jgi:hypothetical protein
LRQLQFHPHPFLPWATWSLSSHKMLHASSWARIGRSRQVHFRLAASSISGTARTFATSVARCRKACCFYSGRLHARRSSLCMCAREARRRRATRPGISSSTTIRAFRVPPLAGVHQCQRPPLKFSSRTHLWALKISSRTHLWVLPQAPSRQPQSQIHS